MVDQGTQLEKIIKDLFQTLDKQYQTNYPLDQYKSEFLPQLKATSPVIINGNPIGGKAAFQEAWLKFPLTQHSITSLDFHPIPGTGTLVINLSGKVRFDETGKTKLGETADIDYQPTGPSAAAARNVWGSWLGFNANLVVDETIVNNQGQGEVINSLNWKIVYRPDDVLVTL